VEDALVAKRSGIVDRELWVALLLMALLALVLATWPHDKDLGSWCGIITRCPTGK